MKAQVFSLKSQEALRRAITRSLRGLYDAIDVQHKVYDEDDDPRKVGESYLQLLRASTIGSGAFTVEVEDEFGSWDYWDSAADIQRADHFLRLPHTAKERVFPSVALLNRMLIVPQGLREALDAPADFAYIFRPLTVQGVLYVDFAAKDAVPDAVARVGAEVRSEIVDLARRHMAMNRVRTPDLEELSALLDVDLEFLDGLREEILRPLPRLAATVVSGPAPLKRSSTVTLEFTNDSANPAGTVDVQIRAPYNKREEPPTRYTRRLHFTAPDEKHQIEIDLFPLASPYCPLEVLFLFDGVMDAVAFPLPLIVDVRDA